MYLIQSLGTIEGMLYCVACLLNRPSATKLFIVIFIKMRKARAFVAAGSSLEYTVGVLL